MSSRGNDDWCEKVLFACHGLTSSQQLSTRQLLAHPSPSPQAGWGGEMDKR